MSKIDKKKNKLQERIDYLQELMNSNLSKKTHNTSEINLPKMLSEIAGLKSKINNLK